VGLGAQPAGDVDGQDQSAVGSPWQWHRGQGPLQPAGIDPAMDEGGVEPTMAAAVFADQRQLGQRPHWPVTAQHGISQLEQRIRTSGETGIELASKA
jgi:hypothetical protein